MCSAAHGTHRPLQQTTVARERQRCLGAALEIAITLARRRTGLEELSSPIHQQGLSATGCVLLLTTGPTTKVR